MCNKKFIGVRDWDGVIYGILSLALLPFFWLTIPLALISIVLGIKRIIVKQHIIGITYVVLGLASLTLTLYCRFVLTWWVIMLKFFPSIML